MAFVKVKVDALEQQKKEYEKAIKSLDGALEQIKKVNASLGTDAMLEGVRTSLTKLAASLETRQGTFLVMIKALEQSGTKYRTAQKKAVTRSNQFRAHHRDFYGNPVVVTVVAGGAGAMAGAAADAGVRPAVYTERGTSTTVSQVSERARNTAAGVPSSNRSETTAGPPVTASTESIGSSVQPVSTEPVPDALGTENGSDPDFGSYIGTAGAAAAGAVIGAATGSVLGTLAGKHPQISGKAAEHKTMKPAAKEKKQEPSTDIEAQLEAARERLRRFNEMEMEEKK